MATRKLSTEERGEFYERMRQSIVYICDQTRILQGGGVFVQVGSSQFVLTTAHVVNEASDLHIVSYDKKSYAVQPLHFDQQRDVALLDVLLKPNNGFVCAQLSDIYDLVRNSEIHFIGHPGRQTFRYNVGNISCAQKTCGNVYKDIGLDHISKYSKYDFIDDFRKLDASVRLIQAKNVHGGGRHGGTGAPFLDADGNILGLYSFTFQEEDHAIHVADIKASIRSFNHKDKEGTSKGKDKNKGKDKGKGKEKA